jgi:hypothetical protein
MVIAKRASEANPSTRGDRAAAAGSAEAQLASFIDKFEPGVATLIRQCRAEVRKLLPTAVELVYDNYNFFVIGYTSTERASDCIVSLAAASNGVGLSFYHGASLPDPSKLLQGSGKQNRFIRLPTVEPLRSPAVVQLIRAAVEQGKTPLAVSGGGHTVIKSVSEKQRPRRKSADPPRG